MQSFCELDRKRDIVGELSAERLIVFRTKGRSPLDANWKNQTTATPPSAFGESDNVGALLGPKAGVVEVYIDDESGIALAPWFLPHTDMIYGRETHDRRGQYLYRTENAGRTRVFHAPPRTRLVTVRSSGSLTLLPPSRVNGGPIRFSSWGVPAEQEYGAIVQASAELAMAIALRPFWIAPRAGRLARALNHLLTLCGWSSSHAAGLIHRMVQAFQDEGIYQPQHVSEANDRNMLRCSEFEEILSAELTDRIISWAATTKYR